MKETEKTPEIENKSDRLKNHESKHSKKISNYIDNKKTLKLLKDKDIKYFKPIQEKSYQSI